MIVWDIFGTWTHVHIGRPFFTISKISKVPSFGNPIVKNGSPNMNMSPGPFFTISKISKVPSFGNPIDLNQFGFVSGWAQIFVPGCVIVIQLGFQKMELWIFWIS